MKTVFFIYGNYTPNNASNNRALAFIKAMSTLEYPITTIFLMPDANYSRINITMPNVNIEYAWNKYYIKKRYIKNISYIYYMYNLYRRVQPGDIVYLYGGVDVLRLLLHKRGVRIYHERTEHPYVHPPRDRFSRPSIKKYLEWCRKIDGLFVCTTCLRDFFLENGVSPNKIRITNTIVDTTRFEGLTKQHSVPYFAYCGNGNNRKDRVDDLIRVFGRVAQRHSDIQLHIIGPTKQVYNGEQDNVKLVQELGLSKRVIFTGIKPADEIPQLMVNALALFITRPDTLQNRAGFSGKIAEYLASGSPVVAATVGDIPLFLKDHENAYLYTPGDLNAIERAMEEILANPSEAQSIGISGRDTAFLYFNALNEAKKMIDFFERR